MRNTPGANILIAVLLGGASLWFMSLGRDFYAQAKTTQMWLSTEGVVLSGDVIARERPFLFDRPRATDRYSYSAKIAYRYSVEGKAYVSNQISSSKRWTDFFESRGSAGAAYEGSWLAMYPVGKKVTVFYDPSDPANALLERDEYWLAYGAFAVAAVAALAGWAMFRAARHQWQEGNRSL